MSLLNLSPCQEKALQALRANPSNVFLTGRAGSGKSFLIRCFLKDKNRHIFPVIASTGAAAVIIGGRTFHSFFGLGIMEGGVKETVRRALDEGRVVRRLEKIEGFILDEVSMVPAPAFRAAEEICRRARNKDLPWGGARVVAVGDFAQLPPVNPFSQVKEWAFLDEAWERSQFVPLLLKTMMRSQDEDYLEALNEIREGRVSESVRTYLDGRIIPETELDTVREVPHLLPRREAAERFNEKRLQEIPKPLKQFPTAYAGDPRSVEALKRNMPIPETLTLKEGALVMMRINDRSFKYVNGSLGHVTKVGADALRVQLKNGEEIEVGEASFTLLNADGREIASATNFPVTLAYATTIHKAQGATWEELVCDLRRLWEPGQAYVALSRLRQGKGLHLIGWDEASIRVDPQVVELHQRLEKNEKLTV